jgi:hypothetical protein
LAFQMFQQEKPTQQDFDDMRDHGYWLSEAFLPNCGIWPESQQTLQHWFGSTKEQHQTRVKFRGIIATSRVIRRDGLVTLLTIGVDNQRYVDLIYPDVDRSELFSYTAIEGRGLYEKNGLSETITIETAKGLSIQKLRLVNLKA